MKIVLATRNPHKVEEMRAILGDLTRGPARRIDLASADEMGVPPVVERATSLEDNARRKAVAVARYTDCWALADDTGLEVDALGGAPGVKTARYAGPRATPRDNMAKLLEALRGVPMIARTARFRTQVVFSRMTVPDKSHCMSLRFSGTLEGVIAEAPRGSSGFGYDPIFIVADDPKLRTLAEMTDGEKNAISHRARALAMFRTVLVTQILR
ncbi:MAG: RdgB/HAM1 family non-canonical purine NTP pyrophosphatase [Polyangiaceae bacterium]